MMDYQTRPITREEIRKYAQIFRKFFEYDEISSFDPIRELDRIHSVMNDVSYEVVADDELPKNVPAVCELDVDGRFVIKIKETVYLGAVAGIGGYRMDITHEIAHAFLYKLGYRPIMNRSFRNNTIPAYKSSEWQAKALAGEIMIPFEASKGMDEKEKMDTFHVSFAAASYRKKMKD